MVADSLCCVIELELLLSDEFLKFWVDAETKPSTKMKTVKMNFFIAI